MPLYSIQKRLFHSMRIDRSLLIVWRSNRILMLLTFVLVAVQGVLPLISLYLLKCVVDAISYGLSGEITPGLINQVAFLLVASGLVSVAQAALQNISAYCSSVQTEQVTDFVTGMVHEKSLSLDLAYYEDPEYYNTLHRAQQEGPYRPAQIVNGVTSVLYNAVSLAAMVGVLFSFHYAAGFMLFLSVIPGFIVQAVFARKWYEWDEKHTEDERRTGYFSSLLTASGFAKELRLFGLGQHFRTLFTTLRLSLRKSKLSLAKKHHVADFFAQLSAIAVLIACLYFIALRTLKGTVSLGEMVMYFQAFQRGATAIKGLAGSLVGLYEHNMFVAHFFTLLNISNNIKEPEKPQPLAAGKTGTLRLDNVSFQYPGERSLVLQDLSLTIKPGEVVALVGANGAGKSTLVKLLCRLHDPASGTLQFDGVDLKQYALSDLRNNISVVFQDFVRYNFSVSENIRFGDITTEPGDEAIKKAAQKAGADAFIDKLPKGYNTPLGRWFDNGEELSLGEWQKLVLARAFLRDAGFIILDEPTSSLDVQTEFYLYTKFRELIGERSALIISHRFSTVKMADTIYVLNDGKIAESGSHAELMAMKGLYADMYAKQAAWME